MKTKWVLIAGLLAAAAVAVVVAMRVSRAPAAERPAALEHVAPRPELNGANVLLITLDTTRADRIATYGYAAAETPNLDRLAGEGVVFEQAITPTPFTLPSHSSIMTGLYPPYHGVRLNGGAALADVQTTLAEQLQGSGYRCGAVIGAFVLDQRWGLGQGFDFYDDDFDIAADQKLDLVGVKRRADQVSDLGLAWLKAEDERPFFAWLHYYDPHTPYDPPEPYRSRHDDGSKSGLYDGEIAFTDAQVGRVLAWLDESGKADDTIVVVIGDHGESLGDHGEKEHGYFIYDATVRVPFVVRVPGSGFAGRRVAQVVRTIDVTPTILDLVGVDAPHPLHGQSLVPLMLDPEGEGPMNAYSESMSVHLQYGWSALYGLRTADHKFIEAPRAELYDLANDSGETDNVLARESEVADELRSELARLRGEIEAGAPEAQEANLDQETLAMLASLGYVGGATAAPEGADLADPKDKIHLYESVGYAAHLMTQDEYEEAAKVLGIVLADDARIPQAKLLLATCYQETDQMEKAKDVLDAFLRDDPDNAPALITMAGILSAEGRSDEVLALARRILAVDDRNTQAYELMAGVYMAAGDHAQALPLLEKAVAIQPKLTRNRLNLAAASIALGRTAAAESMLEAIIDEYPKFPFAHFHLGLLYEEQGRIAEARRAYEEELELYPQSVVARFNLGDLLLRTGDAAGAERAMRFLIETVPEIPRPYLFLARILLKEEQDLSEVERLARAGLERTDDDELKVLGYYLLADVYSREGRQAELEDVLGKAQLHRSRLGR